MRQVRGDMSLAAFAALVHAELADAGIVAVLGGGAAVSIHSGGAYQSDDLDFVTAHPLAEIERVLLRLGFVRDHDPRQAVFTHPLVAWYLEFPAAPLAFGSVTVPASECDELTIDTETLRIITPTHCLMDRLAACGHWEDRAALEEARIVARARQRDIDWAALRDFVEAEGLARHPLVSAFFDESFVEPSPSGGKGAPDTLSP